MHPVGKVDLVAAPIMTCLFCLKCRHVMIHKDGDLYGPRTVDVGSLQKPRYTYVCPECGAEEVTDEFFPQVRMKLMNDGAIFPETLPIPDLNSEEPVKGNKQRLKVVKFPETEGNA